MTETMTKTTRETPSECPSGPRMMSTRADQITPSRPEWLWDRWLSAGALHLLVGRQGGGKSTFAAWVTAQVTTGRPYPDDTAHHEPGNVATLSLEEADDRLVARLHATGADVSRVEVLSDIEDHDDEGQPFHRPWRLPKDCPVLETFIREQQIRLLVVDGLGYSIVGDSHNYAVVGAALSALATMASRTGCAVLGLTHPPKGASDPVTSAIGSTAWTAIPRVVWVLGADPEDESEQRRVCRVSKTNYRPPENGLAFTIGNAEEYECGYVAGLVTSTVTADDLMAARQSDGERTERDEARDMLKSMLSDGPMDTADVLKATRSAGISEITVKRARRDLGVISTPRTDSETHKMVAWQLELPNQRITPQNQGIKPEDHPLFSVGDPLAPTREYINKRGPEDPEDHGGGDPVGRAEDAPPHEDALFTDDQGGDR